MRGRSVGYSEEDMVGCIESPVGSSVCPSICFLILYGSGYFDGSKYTKDWGCPVLQCGGKHSTA